MRRPHGTREWLGALYDHHAAGLYRYAVMILADTEAAADAVQQVFTRLVDRRETLEAEAHYLRRAIRNECFSMLRDRRRWPHAADSHDILEAMAAPHDVLEDRMAVQAALLALPPDQREVVHLKIFEGLTFQEIADLTGESINTIASRYRYALEKMRAVL
jgi:RNA polymerase sigma-70 factor (ECF subfamily)